jgi:hypothetical protein
MLYIVRVWEQSAEENTCTLERERDRRMNKINDRKLSNLYCSINIVKHSLKSPGKILLARKAKADCE